MKHNTFFLALVFAVIGVVVVDAQKTYPECIIGDCLDFLAIAVNCGYVDSNTQITNAQMTCVCEASNGPSEYRVCVVCMNLDTTLTSPLPSECAANLAATSATRTGSSTRTSSSSTRTSSSSSRAPTSAASSRTVSGSANSQTAATRPATTPVQTAPVAPSATGGNLQGFGGCPDGACSGGDSSKTNIYDVTKDSDKVSGAGGVEGARLGWCGVFGLAAMGGIVWL